MRGSCLSYFLAKHEGCHDFFLGGQNAPFKRAGEEATVSWKWAGMQIRSPEGPRNIQICQRGAGHGARGQFLKYAARTRRVLSV